MGLLMLVKVYSIALNMMKKYTRITRSLSTAIHNLPERRSAHKMISVTQCFNRYLQHLSSGQEQQKVVYKITIVVQYVL